MANGKRRFFFLFGSMISILIIFVLSPVGMTVTEIRQNWNWILFVVEFSNTEFCAYVWVWFSFSFAVSHFMLVTAIHLHLIHWIVVLYKKICIYVFNVYVFVIVAFLASQNCSRENVIDCPWLPPPPPPPPLPALSKVKIPNFYMPGICYSVQRQWIPLQCPHYSIGIYLGKCGFNVNRQI